MAISHADCTHPRTPAGRRACRAGNTPAPLVIQSMVTGKLIPVPAPIKMTGATARKMARHAAKADAMRADRERARNATQPPARIQPRRSGARVSTGGSSCVQAALHTTGRCACGWHAENMCNTDVYACAGH